MLQLLLPALIPSWRFFDRIGPAPRIEFALCQTADDTVDDTADDTSVQWQEVRPRPAHVPATSLLARLFWNPRWNECLYLVSCAERLLDDPSPRRATALWTRVAQIVQTDHASAAITHSAYLRVRIVSVMREHDRVVRHVSFVSEAHRLDSSSEAPAS